MNFREYWSDFIRVLLFTIYPTIELYGYFVFVGLYCLEDSKFVDLHILILFLLYHLFITYKVIFYMKLLINEGVSTLEIFPDVPSDGLNLKLEGLNRFVEEDIMKQNMLKIKLCGICKTYKPPRAHHCNTCKRCYLKHDHHCGLLDTCIGFHNYKFFYQFLVLNLISTLFILFTIGIQVMIKKQNKSAIIINYIIALVIFTIEFIINVSFLIMHTRLISNNETTIESYVLDDYIKGDHTFAHIFQEGPISSFSSSVDRTVLNPYNLGRKENWRQVFGSKVGDWFRATYSSIGDGITFPKNYNEYEML